jgi:hypothetical protein
LRMDPLMLKGTDGDVWRLIEQIVNMPSAELRAKLAETKGRGWEYDVDAKGIYTLRFNGVVKGRGDHKAAMARCRLGTAKARVETFGQNQNRRATTGDSGLLAAARLRKFQLENQLNGRGA